MSSPLPALSSPLVVIPFARCTGEGWLQAMKAGSATQLKNLSRLLQGMQQLELDTGDAASLSPPHERVLARTLGLTQGEGKPADGLIAWAADDARRAGLTGVDKAWAYISPCHWAMGREHATLRDPSTLDLGGEDSRTLLAAMQPYFETEGITLYPFAPQRWLAEGELFRNLPTASLDRVISRNVDPWLPGATGQGGAAHAGDGKSPAARTLKRLQNEMQMLLYTHPVNDRRGAARLAPVNSFWASGSGALAQSTGRRLPEVTGQMIEQRELARAVFADDWSAYASAWEHLDATAIAGLLARQSAGESVRLALCGERDARIFVSKKPGMATKISGLLRPKPAIAMLERL